MSTSTSANPSQTNANYDVIVVGGGAAGLMAAGVAAERGRRVLLLEKNRELGQKLRISGGGRCNIANATFDTQLLLGQYGQAKNYLQSPFAQFSTTETFAFFEQLGLPLKTEARNRVFPASQKAEDVVKALEVRARDLGVRIIPNCPVLRMKMEENKVVGVETKKGAFGAESVILATGGLSHPETGSTGDGFGWLRDLGHEVRKPTPSIVPMATKERWSHGLSGKTVEARVWLSLDGQRQAKSRSEGRVLFTHFGLSGPTVLNLAATAGQLLESGGKVEVHLDLWPGQDEGQVDRSLTSLLDNHKNKDLKTALKLWLPNGLGLALMKRLQLDPETKVHSLSRVDRKRLVGLSKSITLTVRHLLGFEKAVVADGGVSLDEVDTRSMRSKMVENLFIIGDLLDVRRPSGGYSLQLCWTTGWVAGSVA